MARTRHRSSVTSVSWIPSEAVIGSTKIALEAGMAHYDPPPPEKIEDLEALRDADRFRPANVLEGWIDVDDEGKILAHGASGGGVMGSTAVKIGPMLRRRPFVQWQAPLVWTTLALTLQADGRAEGRLEGASRFPRHWAYDADGVLSHKSGLADFKDWYRHSFGRHTPWGDQDSEALVTAVETALERSFSHHIMRGPEKPAIRRVKSGATLVHQGDAGTEVFLILDGVLRVEHDGQRLAEYGPGAVLGERAHLEDAARSSTLVAVTPCKVAAVDAAQLDRAALEELALGHRREVDALPAGGLEAAP